MRYAGRYKIPTYAVNFIEYGDSCGLTDMEVELINAFLDSEFSNHGYVADWIGIDEPFFSPYPDIGALAAEVVEADFYYA